MFRFSRLFLLSICLLVLTITVMAQDSTCPAIVEAALEAVESLCSDTGRNEACYGNLALTAEPREGVTEFQFAQPGDITTVADIATITLTGMDVAANTWGVALLRIQANLPETLPGENVTMLLFGDVEITNTGGVDSEDEAYGDMQAFYFRSGIGDAQCAEAPTSGILIQTPDGAGQVNLVANDIQITLGSTAFMQAEPGGNFVISVLEGEGMVTANGASVTVPAGGQVTVPLDETGFPDGIPTYPEPFDGAQIDSLPADSMPDPFDTAQPISSDTSPLLFTVLSATLNTDPGERVLYPGARGDFVAETQLSFAPDHNFQGAGIYAELSGGGRIEFVLAFCDDGGAVCVGRGLYMDVFTAPGFSSLLLHEVGVYRAPGVYLQLEYLGGTFTGRYRRHSAAPWTDSASFTASATITEVGIVAQSASGVSSNPEGAPNITATFTNFTITRP